MQSPFKEQYVRGINSFERWQGIIKAISQLAQFVKAIDKDHYHVSVAASVTSVLYQYILIYIQW